MQCKLRTSVGFSRALHVYLLLEVGDRGGCRQFVHFPVYWITVNTDFAETLHAA